MRSVAITCVSECFKETNMYVLFFMYWFITLFWLAKVPVVFVAFESSNPTLETVTPLLTKT